MAHDSKLVSVAQGLASGADVHEVGNLCHSYINLHYILDKTGDATKWGEKAAAAERKLRAKVGELKKARLLIAA